MSNKLIEILKFVRDLQRETSKGDDLNAVVNEDLKFELNSDPLKNELRLKTLEFYENNADKIKKVNIKEALHNSIY